MARSSITVHQLAVEADTDLEDVIISLWDIGINHVLSPSDKISYSDADRARKALGVATLSELRSIDYWCLLLGLSTADFKSMLNKDFGVMVSSDARNIPRGLLRKLKFLARSRGIDPLSGRIQHAGVVEPPPEQVIEPVNIQRGVLGGSDAEWTVSGHVKALRWLTESEIMGIHYALVADFSKSHDPIVPDGARSQSLLASAAFRPQTSLGERLKYPTVESSAAALMHALIQGHTFHNGTKRTALVAILVFLDENGVFLTCDGDDLLRLSLKIAQHRIAEVPYRHPFSDCEVLAISKWICANSRLVEKWEKPMPWRKLRRILVAYGCSCDIAGGVGNRINIVGSKIEKSWYGAKKTIPLRTQVHYGDEGTEVYVSEIKKIRADLHLDDMHGVDSRKFYGKEGSQVEDFIARYRKTLYRLAKF